MSKSPTPRALVLTFVALIVLAVASWVAAALGTGTWIALAIAAVKALAIAAIFMELWFAQPVDKVIAVVALLFVILLCVGTLADVGYR